ncbi:MAG: ATP-dependent DNA helicase RecG [Clostridiales Family XIII bacterium]|jgi:ATP-dependent DNA helicase RecG|nr:ATP-dependent DNA helicase RecG [Clostridiales Family XIII bacterium]
MPIDGAKVMTPDSSVSSLKGVGPKKAASLAAVGIKTVENLLYSFPRTYEDRRKKVKIAGLSAGEAAGFEGKVLSVSGKPAYVARGRRIPFTVLVGDDTGAVELVFFNARYIDRLLLPGRSFRFFGTPRVGAGRLQVIHPDFARSEDAATWADRPIMPVYSLTAGLTQKDMRAWHETALPAAASLREYLPADIMARARLCDIAYALANIHFPTEREALSAAKYRLIFEELLLLQTGLMWLKTGRGGQTAEKGIRFQKNPPLSSFEKLLSYALTGAQRRTVGEIYADMETERPMNRLVQGDVGSGKTAVAMAAIWKAVHSGFQAVMMAPTEILAKQHYAELTTVFADVSVGDNASSGNRPLRVALLTAGVKSAERKEILAALAVGEIDIAVGTHALLQPDIAFARLGLVITDEQHRFGVNQRITLTKKGGRPDVLVMTATPIPRSLALILYGDLDISLIDEMPPGRKRIVTKAVSSGKRGKVYALLEDELRKGRQAYVVAPLIEDGENSDDAPIPVRSAESLYEELKARFRDYRVALLHGNVKQYEKNRVMSEYNDGEIQVLVSTVVIEVGVNVPNATVMVVENAERFGLAQLHQLRGRVGRGGEQSYCVLVVNSESKDAVARARTLVETDDGFEIAEKDLSMRGAGELFGVRQHGIPNLRIADLARHAHIVSRVRDEASALLASDPCLKQPQNADFRRRIDAMFLDVSDLGI